MIGSIALWSRAARTRSLPLAAALLAALGMLSLFVARAEAVVLAHTDAPLSGSDFQAGDGDQDRTALLKDWQDFGGFPSKATAPDASPDFTFVQGSDEGNPGAWIEAQTTPSPPKTNFLSAWSINDGDEFFYYSFNREDSGGNTHLAFELNQDRRLWHNKPGTHPSQTIPCRTAGDLSISYSVQSNLNIDVVIEVWETTNAVTPAESATFADGVGCAQVGAFDEILQSDLPPGSPLLTNLLQAAINTQGPIGNYLSTATFGNTIPEGEFGEGAVNLTDLFSEVLDDPCFSFGSFWMHGRSSQSPSSALQDYIDPVDVVVRSCTISGTKYHDLEGDGSIQGDPVITGWKLYLDLDNDNQLDAGEPTAITDASGLYEFKELSNASYTVREAPSAMQAPALQGYSCTFPSSDDDECEHVASITAENRNSAGNDFGNAKPGKVIIRKVNVGGTQSDAFPFTSQGLGAANASFSLAATDATGEVIDAVAAGGSYSVTEGAGAPADQYDLTALDCDDIDSTQNAGQTTLDTRTATIRVSSGETVACTFTNTRKQGQLTVRKVLDPTTDQGKFDLMIGGDLVVDDGGHLAQETRTLDTGTNYTVSEVAGAGSSLAQYDSSVECKDGATTVASGSGTSLSGVPVVQGHNVVCTFTNVRRPGTIQVVKELVPDTDTGTFDLMVDSTVVKAAATDGQGGSTNVAPGSYTVSEVGANGTSLAKYDSSIECKKGQAVVKAGTGSSLAGVTVDSDDQVVCTITNTRRQASITVVKDLHPASDAGRFDLKVDDDVVKSEAGDGDEGSRNVAPGAYTVSEVAHTGTSLAKYDSSVECVKNGEAYKDGDGASLPGIEVDSNDIVVCTITNTRREGSIKVIKQLVPSDDGGTFDLRVGADVVTAGAGDGDSGTKSVAPGTYSVSEDGAGDTSLEDYDSAVACEKNGQGYKQAAGTSIEGLAVDSDDAVVCTITNTRLGTVEVEKQTDPETGDSFHFGSDLPGGGFDLTDDGVKTVTRVLPGSYTVTEDDPAPAYDLTGIACDDGQSETASTISKADRKAIIEVDPGEVVRCVFVNTERGSVTVTKTEAGGPAVGRWTFRLTGGPDQVHFTKDTDADGNPMSFGRLKPGEYTLCEVGMPIDWHSSLENAPHDGERSEDGQAGTATVCVAILIVPGEAETLTVDNTRPGTLVIKEGNLLIHHGDTITYTFNVSNSGNTPLEDVSVADERCDEVPVRDAANDQNADGDALLESAGTPDGGSSEVWRFTCTRVASAQHGEGEENPVVNVATAHAFDQAGNEVTATDDHSTRIIHPGIAVDKTLRRAGDEEFVQGPIRAHVGDTIDYRFEVTNEGDTPLVVDFSDPKCDQQPDSPDSGDDGDGRLEVDETWVYRCSHLVTDADADPLENTVTVKGSDELGGAKGTVTDTDTEMADVLHPDIEVDKQVRILDTGEFVAEGLKAHVGDTLEYRFDVTDGESDTPIAGVQLDDPRCDAGTLQGPSISGEGSDDDELLEAGETWTYRCTHVVTEADPDPLPNTVTVTGADELGGEVSDEDSTSVEILKPGTLVVKEGNVFAYPGDTVSFTFAVTNNGNTPLSDVSVTDDRCAPVTGPSQKLDGDQDDLLEVGERWIFTCSKQIPAGHKIGDENPIRNVATATGKDELGKTVTATDDHLVTVLHPAIDIEKTGPATATVGAALAYTLTVTNPGDVPFAAQEVGVSDPRCEQPPAGPNTGADQSPGRLDPADTWTYTCTAQTSGQPAGTFVNTATVTARDFNGRAVSDTDEFPTLLEAQQVLPQPEIVSGTARLRGPSGCVRKPFKATVRGSRIKQVTFYRDGKQIKRIVAKRGQRKFTLRIKPGKEGLHRITARVVFKAASRTRARTLRLSYQRCRKQVVRPRFTG